MTSLLPFSSSSRSFCFLDSLSSFPLAVTVFPPFDFFTLRFKKQKKKNNGRREKEKEREREREVERNQKKIKKQLKLALAPLKQSFFLFPFSSICFLPRFA